MPQSEGLCSAAFLSEFTFVVVKPLKYNVGALSGFVVGFFFFPLLIL